MVNKIWYCYKHTNKKHIDKNGNKVLKKETKKIFFSLYSITVAGWLIFTVIWFGMNPMVHNSKQKVVGAGVLLEEAAMQEEVDMEKVREEGNKEVKEKEQEIHQELKEVKEQSAEDYNNFLKSLNQ